MGDTRRCGYHSLTERSSSSSRYLRDFTLTEMMNFMVNFFPHMIRAIKISKPFALLSVFLHCRLLDVCLETGLVSDYLVIAGEGLVVPPECEPRMLSSLWTFPSTVVLSGSLFTKNLLIFEECTSFPTHSFPLREGRVS